MWHDDYVVLFRLCYSGKAFKGLKPLNQNFWKIFHEHAAIGYNTVDMDNSRKSKNLNTKEKLISSIPHLIPKPINPQSTRVNNTHLGSISSELLTKFFHRSLINHDNNLICLLKNQTAGIIANELK